MSTLDDAVPMRVTIENETDVFNALRALAGGWAKAQAAALRREIADAEAGIMRRAALDPPGRRSELPPPPSESETSFENQFALKFWQRIAASLARTGMGWSVTDDDVLLADEHGIPLLAPISAARGNAEGGEGDVSGMEQPERGRNLEELLTVQTMEPISILIGEMYFTLPTGTVLRGSEAHFREAGLRVDKRRPYNKHPGLWRA